MEEAVIKRIMPNSLEAEQSVPRGKESEWTFTASRWIW